MRALHYLIRVHRGVYLWCWGVMAVVFVVLMSTFAIFGHWASGNDQPSAWQAFGRQLAIWLLFTMGIMLVSVRLPVAIANGVTRREFCAAAGVFALGSAVLFGLLDLVAYAVEYVVYQAYGMMDELAVPYPVPGVASFGHNVLVYLTYMLTGALFSILYYRLPVWWAIALSPLAALPMPIAFGIKIPSMAVLGGGGWLLPAVAASAALATYLLARSAPVRPKKA